LVEILTKPLRRWRRQTLYRTTPKAATAQLMQPTLILHGDQDDPLSLEPSQRRSSILLKAWLTVLHGAGYQPVYIYGAGDYELL
jgi:pimeloyl-ACP methyl ester carboxylesterase